MPKQDRILHSLRMHDVRVRIVQSYEGELIADISPVVSPASLNVILNYLRAEGFLPDEQPYCGSDLLYRSESFVKVFLDDGTTETYFGPAEAVFDEEHGEATIFFQGKTFGLEGVLKVERG